MKNPKKNKRQLLLFLLLLLALGSFAQKTTVKVSDNSTTEPCLCANVVFYNMANELIKGTITNKLGIAEFDLKEQAILVVSYVGYNSYTDTVSPGESIDIKLSPNNFEMDAIVVTGQYEPKPVDKSIYKIDIVSSESMQARGVNNLAEALSAETGIRLSVDPATGTSIELQGMGGENVKYLIDGIPITGRVNGIVDLSQINMENIDHIEIVKGPMSVQYGTSAIAGVINIITKKNAYFSNLAKFNSYIDTKGNYNFGLYGSVIRGKHGFAFSANRNLFQGYDMDLNVDEDKEDGHDRYMEFKPKRVYNLDAEYSYTKNKLQIKIKSQYMNTLVKNYSNYLDKVVMAYDNDFYTTRSINSLTISNNVSEKFSYNVIGAYTYFGRQTDYISSDLALLTKEITKTTHTLFNNVMTRGSFTYLPGNDLSIMSGWDINYDNGTGDKIEEGAEMGDYAYFLSGQYSPGEVISIQPGIRVIYNSVFKPTDLFTKTDSTHWSPFIPSLNVQFNVLSNLSLRLSYAKGFRAPSLKELYLDFKDSNHDLSGNKDLKPESTNSYNASITYTTKNSIHGLKLEPSFFYNDGKNAITLIVTDAESNSATNVNLGGRRTYGGEMNLSYRYQSGFSFGAGFSRIGETYDYGGTGDYVPVVYYNNYSFSSKYHFTSIKTVLLANLKLYGKTPSLAVIPDEFGGGYYNVFTDPYGDLEITLTKMFWNNKVNIVVGGKNLLNTLGVKTYTYRNYYDLPDFKPEQISPKNYGRTYFIKVNVKLNS